MHDDDVVQPRFIFLTHPEDRAAAEKLLAAPQKDTTPMYDPTDEDISQAMNALIVEIAAYSETARQIRLARAHYDLGEPLSMASMAFPIWRLIGSIEELSE